MQSKLKTIFIQIASYRDPELLPTIKDALAKAKYPERLTFGISHQFNSEDKFSEDFRDYVEKLNTKEFLVKTNDIKILSSKAKKWKLAKKQFRIISIPYELSKGACWARYLLQQLYRGEDYTLQLDSHMRFEQDWDETLIEWNQQLKDMGHPKPLITAYVPSYNPENDPAERVQEPWRLTFDRFIPEGAIFFLPEVIPNWEDIIAPVPSRFYSAHFAFADGCFATEVQHDPNMYFHGEEISISVRAFTHGYDLFNPHRVVIWHEYTRKGRTKQWDDDKDWVAKNISSHSVNRRLLKMDNEESLPKDYKYGFGIERTLEEYEIYNGVKFSDRSVQAATIQKFYPPNDPEQEFVKIFKHCIDISLDQLPLEDYHFIVVTFEDADGNTIHRQDISETEFPNLKAQAIADNYFKIWRSFYIEASQPKKWVVWAKSHSQDWQQKIEGWL